MGRKRKLSGSSPAVKVSHEKTSKRKARSRSVDSKSKQTIVKSKIKDSRSKSTSTRRVLIKPTSSAASMKNNNAYPVTDEVMTEINTDQEPTDNVIFNDQVIVSMDPTEEEEFNTNVEEDSEVESDDNSSCVYLSKVMNANQVVSQQSTDDNLGADQIAQLKKNPAIASYISKLVAKELNRQTSVSTPTTSKPSKSSKEDQDQNMCTPTGRGGGSTEKILKEG